MWEWAVYSEWDPGITWEWEIRDSVIQVVPAEARNPDSKTAVYVKVKRQRWSWLPGQDVIRIEITKDEYESMVTAKGGQ